MGGRPPTQFAAVCPAQAEPREPSPDKPWVTPFVDIPDEDCLRIKGPRGRGFVHWTARMIMRSVLLKVQNETAVAGRRVSCVSISTDNLFFSMFALR